MACWLGACVEITTKTKIQRAFLKAKQSWEVFRVNEIPFDKCRF